MLVLIVALPVTFIAMNPMGALDIVVTTGQFIFMTLMDMVKAGFAGVWYVVQMVVTGIANLFIGAGNLVIGAINAWFQKIVPSFQLIPTLKYLEMPEIPTTIQSIVNEIMDGYTQLRAKVTDYWSVVQANAPMTYVSGAVAGGGSAGATYLLAQETSEKTRMAITPKPKRRKSSKSPKIITLSSKSSSARKSSSSRKSKSSSSGRKTPRDIYLELLEPEYVSKQRKMPKTKTTKTQKPKIITVSRKSRGSKVSKSSKDIYLELLEPEYVSKQRKLPEPPKKPISGLTYEQAKTILEKFKRGGISKQKDGTWKYIPPREY